MPVPFAKAGENGCGFMVSLTFYSKKEKKKVSWRFLQCCLVRERTLSFIQGHIATRTNFGGIRFQLVRTKSLQLHNRWRIRAENFKLASNDPAKSSRNSEQKKKKKSKLRKFVSINSSSVVSR